MRKLGAILTILVVAVMYTYSQDWTESSDRTAEFNCELISAIIDDYGEQPYQREGDNVLTLFEFYEISIPACLATDEDIPPVESAFKIAVKQNVNLRDCAGTTCSLVGQAKPGQILEVVAENDNWYEIKHEQGTAFIAGWLATRLPDAIVETDEPYTIETANCMVLPDPSRSSDMDVSFVIAGERRANVVVDLFAPTQDRALRVDSQLQKTFIDTGDPYILQVYRWNQWFPSGIYRIELGIDGNVYELAWNITERADYNVYVFCE